MHYFRTKLLFLSMVSNYRPFETVTHNGIGRLDSYYNHFEILSDGHSNDQGSLPSLRDEGLFLATVRDCFEAATTSSSNMAY